MYLRRISPAALALAFATISCSSNNNSGPPSAVMMDDAQGDLCSADTTALPWAGLKSSAAGFTVAVQSDPAIPMLGDRKTKWTLTIDDAQGNPVPAGTVVKLQGQMIHTGNVPSHGLAVDPIVTEAGNGVYDAAPVVFNMQGHWHMEVAVGSAAIPFDVCVE